MGGGRHKSALHTQLFTQLFLKLYYLSTMDHLTSPRGVVEAALLTMEQLQERAAGLPDCKYGQYLRHQRIPAGQVPTAAVKRHCAPAEEANGCTQEGSRASQQTGKWYANDRRGTIPTPQAIYWQCLRCFSVQHQSHTSLIWPTSDVCSKHLLCAHHHHSPWTDVGFVANPPTGFEGFDRDREDF